MRDPRRRAVLQLASCVLLVLGLILPVQLVPAIDLDFGGIIENDTGVVWTPATTFQQRDKLSLFGSTNIGEQFTLGLRASYTYTPAIPLMIDLEYLELAGTLPGFPGQRSSLSFSAGRFYFSDFSGAIFSGTIDGIALDLTRPVFAISATAGYTGLQLKPTSSIALSNLDIVDRFDPAVTFAPRRLIEGVRITLPQVLLRQTVDFSVLLQQDLRPIDGLVNEGDETEATDGGGRVESQYFGIGLSGPIAGQLYYRLSGYLQTGKFLSYRDDSSSASGGSYQTSQILAGLGDLGLEFYLSELLSSRIGAGVRVASGDVDYTQFAEGNNSGRATMFAPITSAGASYIFSPQVGNVTSSRLSYSFLPLSFARSSVADQLRATVVAFAYFRTVPGVISVDGLNPDSDSHYLGTEIDVSFNYRPLSDLGLSVGGGAFLPHTSGGTGALLADVWSNRFFAKLAFSFSF